MKKAAINRHSSIFGHPFVNILWMFIFAIYGSAAALWWLIMPHGFAVNHPRFWANSGFPLMIAVVSLLGILALLSTKIKFAKTAATFFVGLTTAAFIFSLIQFPISFGPSNGLRFGIFILLVGGGCLLLLLVTDWLFWVHRRTSVSYGLIIVGTMISMVIGIGFVRAQKSLSAATVPINSAIPISLEQLSRSEGELQQPTPFKDNTAIWPEEAMVQTQCGELGLQISPLLTFTSRSPDRFWTVFAPPLDRLGLRRRLSHYKLTDDRLLFSYSDDDRSWLDLQGKGEGALKLESYSQLPNPVYSHLNTY